MVSRDFVILRCIVKSFQQSAVQQRLTPNFQAYVGTFYVQKLCKDK